MTAIPPRRSGAPLIALLLSGALAFAGGPAEGQVNIEDLRPDDPPEGYSGSLGGDVTLRTGNVDFVRIGVRVRVNHVDGEVHTLLVGDGGLGFLGRSRFDSSGLFHYRRTYWLARWVAPEWFGQVNYDRSRNLGFRTLAGGGVRTPTYEPGWGRVGGGTSLMLEHERFTLPDTADHPRTTLAVRSSTFLTFHAVFGEESVLSATSYVQPRVLTLGDLRILHDLSLATGITERVDLTVTFDLRYDSRPPDDVARLDTRLRTGVTLNY